MIDDRVVEEVRRAKGKLFADCGGDLVQLYKRLKEGESEHPERLMQTAEGARRRPSAPVERQNETQTRKSA